MNDHVFPFQPFNNLNFKYNALCLQSSGDSLTVFDLQSLSLSRDWLINI